MTKKCLYVSGLKQNLVSIASSAPAAAGMDGNSIEPKVPMPAHYDDIHLPAPAWSYRIIFSE